jgi:hypothetical protein
VQVAEREEPGPGARRRRDQRERHEDGRRPRHPLAATDPLPPLDLVESTEFQG